MLILFWVFFQVGLVSFGGGYAMIPVIQHYVVDVHLWMSMEQYLSAVAMAGIAPGPMASSIAIAVGYHINGWLGAFVACFAVTLPCLLLVLMLGVLLQKRGQHWLIQGSLQTLRPAVVGVVAYSAISYGQGAGAFAISPQALLILAIAGVGLALMQKTKLHPLILIAGAAVMGMAAVLVGII